MSTGSDGWAVKCAVQAALPFTTSAKPFELSASGESMTRKRTILNTQGIYGSRSQHAERSRFGQEDVTGSITFEWSPEFGAFILPFILGATASGTTFALAEALPVFQLQIDKVSKVYTYTDCMVNKATWKGSSGGYVTCTLDLIAVTEVMADAGTFQVLTAPLEIPYVFSDGAASLDGDARTIFDFEVSVDNKLAARFANRTIATRIAPSDLREVTFTTTTPWGSTEVDLYNQALAGIAVALTLTNGNYSTLFSMGSVQFPSETPVVGGKGEIPLKLTGIARMTGTTKELIVTHDSTP